MFLRKAHTCTACENLHIYFQINGCYLVVVVVLGGAIKKEIRTYDFLPNLVLILLAFQSLHG